MDEKIENLIDGLPDPDAARRFVSELERRFPAEFHRLRSKHGLLADVLTLVAFSPLLATTLLQHKSYLAWLDRQRTSSKVRGKEDLLESLARFELTNSMLETNVLLSRFRRRELLRIYLQDIRGLETIAEITEEISNLADAILEHALRIAKQELDNRFGAPQETDEKGRAADARFAVVALGKLGSRELNYSSDIDLLFLYSSEGRTTGNGTRGAVTNREYFVRLAEQIIGLVGRQTGEGAAYRVDMRLRPHGRVGALAIAADEAANYYLDAAQPWERQVLIRSRACAGDPEVFSAFFERVRSGVFDRDLPVAEALRNVRASKIKIDRERSPHATFDVKLGCGGIREIEFIAQALQLAHAGSDDWLCAPHTLISLARLADRHLVTESEHTELAAAYTFLRRLEHRLQMEHGLQTHLVPDEPERRAVVAKRMGFADTRSFDLALSANTAAVSRVFARVFAGADAAELPAQGETVAPVRMDPDDRNPAFESAIASIGKSGLPVTDSKLSLLRRLSNVSPYFAGIVAANPDLVNVIPEPGAGRIDRDYASEFAQTVGRAHDLSARLAAIRSLHSRRVLELAVAEVFGDLDVPGSKRCQTAIAEASVAAAIEIVRHEMERRVGTTIGDLGLAILGLGKFGGNSLDYGSDLDLVIAYDDEATAKLLHASGNTAAAFCGKAVEVFVTALSAMTRDGSLYRVDLRLRPDGKNGAPANSRESLVSYFEHRAAIWEWLAYVKIRGVGGDLDLARDIAGRIRAIIHRRARTTPVGDLVSETIRVRTMLEETRAGARRKETDIKYGAGGMLDVYFATRFLQLRDDVPDDDTDRSTAAVLRRLEERGSLAPADFQPLRDGYRFLSGLDHEIRLTIGRSTRFPAANRDALEIIAERLGLGSESELTGNLALHRMEIRAAFERVVRA